MGDRTTWTAEVQPSQNQPAVEEIFRGFRTSRCRILLCSRALNKFLTQYDWDAKERNHERLEELQNHGQTHWSQDGYTISNDPMSQRTVAADTAFHNWLIRYEYMTESIEPFPTEVA